MTEGSHQDRPRKIVDRKKQDRPRKIVDRKKLLSIESLDRMTERKTECEQRPKVFILRRAVSRRPKRVHARKIKGKTGLRGS
ncbi:hypothetical protein Hanom_Chr14g01253661 [Helianthus anomalus]